jgi:hypothetical protein
MDYFAFRMFFSCARPSVKTPLSRSNTSCLGSETAERVSPVSVIFCHGRAGICGNQVWETLANRHRLCYAIKKEKGINIEIKHFLKLAIK